MGLAIAMWYGVAACPVPVRADSGSGTTQDTSSADYRELVAKGLDEYNGGRYLEARAFFLRAHAAYPNARTLRSLGITSYALREYVAAVGYLQLALENTVKPLTAEMRAEVESALADARGFVTRVTLSIDAKDPTLWIDGQAPTFDHDGALLLDPGSHELVTDAPGYTRDSRTISASGSALEISIRLIPEPTQTSPPAAMAATARTQSAPEDLSSPFVDRPHESEPDSFWESLGPLQIAGLGCGVGAVVGAGLGVTFSVLAADANQASEKHCDSSGCDAVGFEQRNTALSRADIATVSFVAAGVLAATGAVLFFVGAPAERQTSKLRLAPVIALHGAGVDVRSTF